MRVSWEKKEQYVFFTFPVWEGMDRHPGIFRISSCSSSFLLLLLLMLLHLLEISPSTKSSSVRHRLKRDLEERVELEEEELTQIEKEEKGRGVWEKREYLEGSILKCDVYGGGRKNLVVS